METLASVWACDPCDLSDLGQKPSSAWESQWDFSGSPSAGLMWTEQLSPHLQRNKQLQDTLLQREEEVARLQEENNKLREFLNSSFVRNLEEKTKKLPADGRRKLKRNLMHIDDGSLLVSKRVCRNLTAEFCSETSKTSSSFSEPNLDLWVLRTLGLKDRDTIDTSNESSSSPRYCLSSSIYGVALTSSSESTLDSSFSPSVASSTPSSVHSYCQTDYRHSAAECQEANCSKSAENCTTSPGQCPDFTATGTTRQYEAPGAPIRNYNTLTAFQSPPKTEQQNFSQSPGIAEICSITALNQVQTLEGNPVKQPAYWSPISLAPSLDKIQFSPPGERILFSPLLSSSPVTNQLTPVSSPSAGSQPPAMPQTPSSRTDLAFSMSLSPSSSVKTHSFPHGQAFVRKDPEGKWNFTWVPRQGP